MNMESLYSILSLYLKQETDDRKVVLNIQKLENEIEFSFNMTKNIEEKTSFAVSFDEYRKNIINFVNLYKEDLLVIDEKYNYNSINSTCSYYVQFKNGRVISFNGFTVLETNSIRNYLYDIRINSEELRISDIEDNKQMAYKPRLRLQQAGFTSYVSLFVIIFFLAIILGIVMYIFK